MGGNQGRNDALPVQTIQGNVNAGGGVANEERSASSMTVWARVVVVAVVARRLK